MPRSELTLTIKRVEGMIDYVRENLDEGEYDLFLDLVLPEPEPVRAAKKGRKKGSSCSHVYPSGATCNRAPATTVHITRNHVDYHEFQPPKKSGKGGSKSSRASSLQQQLKATASRTITGPACGICGNVEDHPDHDTTHYLSAHEFNTGKSAADIMAHEAGAGG